MISSNIELISLASCLLSGFFSGSEVLMSIGIDGARQIIDQGGTRGKA